ncbi:MAG: hypothetical protein O2906_03770 [Bacteroidetes bacterium]|nr:hypothetical protein [Bacteroidota bacterium]MDA0860078.1 hypothetical protein [Bacteroidota bacterium]MDA1318175.1 hypothetical protein [Bacteroidota bacterium]
MSLKHIKCNIFFTIGWLSLTLFLGCRSEQNVESKIETTRSEKSPLSKLKTNTNTNFTLDIDDAALVELDQWTSFFILQKEIVKLEQNNANSFQENEKRISTYFKDLDLNIPKVFNTNTIWARLKVLETEIYLYNEISNSNGTQELLKTARENIIYAYQNLVRQINKTHEKATQGIDK